MTPRNKKRTQPSRIKWLISPIEEEERATTIRSNLAQYLNMVHRLLPCFLQWTLFLVACLVYINSLHGDFAFDDSFAILNNPDVKNNSAPLFNLLKHDFWGQNIRNPASHKSYRPLTVLLFRAVKYVGTDGTDEIRDKSSKGAAEMSPYPFHVVNVILHAVVSLLVSRLALRLAQLRETGVNASIALKEKDETGSESEGTKAGAHVADSKNAGVKNLRQRKAPPVCIKEEENPGATMSPAWADIKNFPRISEESLLLESSIAGFLFAVHPIHTEAVAGLVGLAETLCASLGLCAILCYIDAVASQSSARSLFLLGSAMVLSMLAAFSKEIGITVIGTMALLDILLLDRTSMVSIRRPPPKARQFSLAFRIMCLFFTGGMYVVIRQWVSGGQHIVNIYRKVENPIPYADSWLVRTLTTGYLHAKYAWLLIYPMHLSADWSFACIPYVEMLSDTRNVMSLALYLFLVAILISGKPWQLARALIGGRNPDDQLTAAHWRLLVVYGFILVPFFPATNVLFYVGTFIGERLLYFPSVGFCMLLANTLSSVLAPPSRPQLENERNITVQGSKLVTKWKSSSRKHSSLTVKPMIGLALMMLLGFYSWRTLLRNEDWKDEESLFIAAQKICLNSAKVRLNSGILERRHANWEAALQHFHLAIEIDPTYCDPVYWIGLTLMNRNEVDKGISKLEEALGCKHSTAKALDALNKVLGTLSIENADNPRVPLRWGKALLHPAVNLPRDGCGALEQAAIMGSIVYRNHEIVSEAYQECTKAIQKTLLKANPSTASTREPDLLSEGRYLRGFLECVEARKVVVHTIVEHGHMSVQALRSLYRYINEIGGECRSKYHLTGGTSIHKLLVHRFQSQAAEDPWLQLEWSKILLQSNQLSLAIRHLEAAAMIFTAYLDKLMEGPPTPSPNVSHPLSMSTDGPLTIQEAEDKAVEAFELLVALNETGKDVCNYLSGICSAKLSAVKLKGRSDKQWIDSCLNGLESKPQCGAEKARVVQLLKSRFG